ncbi:MAG: large-conductance mechanosensitive channel protein MscL [Candidatus Falkowbacteria bacterium]|nr:MAG: large-conductance mechanosensitive channel protein MscL [Candidatus Falkowbacteria bacterium]
MKKYFQEFKAFAVKGNVVDLAVAVIIGGAFGKIVSSLVSDVVMPLIGVIAGGLDFTSWKIILKQAVIGSDGVLASPAVTMNIGVFVQNIFDFLIIALSIFFMVKVLGRIKKRLINEEEDKKKEEKSAPLTKDQELLVEIRDLLKNKPE